ncbi:MAG: GNAT family N-acetyltransferase [Polyangiaceae bacterium]|nr:GNAT family N-acetyltransferase [Polyangiaceae bacterium]
MGLVLPPRSTLRKAGLASPRTLLFPIDVSDAPELWTTIDASRWHLERWLPWVPYNGSLETTMHYAEASAADWDAGRALRFCIRSNPGHELLGVVGLDSCVYLHRSCELGYWLKREATGRGLMTEAAKACIDFAFRTVGFHRIRCAAGTNNYPSLRVIGRLGFRFEGIARQAELVGTRWLDHAVFARLAVDDPPP